MSQFPELAHKRATASASYATEISMTAVWVRSAKLINRKRFDKIAQPVN